MAASVFSLQRMLDFPPRGRCMLSSSNAFELFAYPFTDQKARTIMLSIGEFSKICGVSTKALRYYDEIGLLKPEAVNAENGYRYYTIGQLKPMLLINRLKSYRFSLEEIGAVLQDPTEEKLLAALAHKQAEIQSAAYDLAASLQQLQTDITNIERGIPIMQYIDNITVSLVETQPQTLLSLRGIVGTDGYAQFIGRLQERIMADRLTVTGAPTTFYHSPEFDPDASDTEVAIPIQETVEGTRLLPAQQCAKAVHRGGYSGLTAVYARLREWVEAEGYAIADAPYEVYISDPRQAKSPADIVTEVYFPVKK